MKTIKIAPRTIELVVGILATAMIVAGVALYAWNEPTRLQEAQTRQLASDLDGAMTLYAQNCAVCHGAGGEGIGATPALNNPALQETDAEAITKIISRGLYSSAMAAWSLEDGGPLSEYQINQLVNLIHHGDWIETQSRVVNLGLAPLIPFASEADPLILDNLTELPQGDTLAAGISLYAENCVACHGADGVGTTLAPALNDPAVRAQNAVDLERTIRLGTPGTLMAGWEKALDDEQITALLELMLRWDEIPTGAIPAPDEPILVTAESLALGSELYAASCDNCHGPEGQGSQRAPSLNVRSYLAETPDAALQQIITLGVPETSMPAWGDRLSEAQIQAIVGFIRSWEPTAPEVAQPVRVRGPWWQGNTAAGDSPQLPSGGASTAANPEAAIPAPSATSGDLANKQPEGNAGGNSPWVAQELPWYQTLDPRAIVLALSVIFIASLIILAALHGLRRLA
ncbi:MAG: c-type cytochrome [Anaerolineales bacterium]|nr:c-type cytochrome [Anaerolineales bacterium]